MQHRLTGWLRDWENRMKRKRDRERFELQVACFDTVEQKWWWWWWRQRWRKRKRTNGNMSIKTYHTCTAKKVTQNEFHTLSCIGQYYIHIHTHSYYLSLSLSQIHTHTHIQPKIWFFPPCTKYCCECATVIVSLSNPNYGQVWNSYFHTQTELRKRVRRAATAKQWNSDKS